MSRVDRIAGAGAGAVALAILVSSAAFAAPKASTGSKPKSTDTENLRPTGPVKINADRAEWQKGGSMVYTGNVRLESGDLKLSGDRLNLKQFDDGQFEAKIDGKPAKLDHAGLAAAGNKEGERPPVAARASTLTYNSRDEIVVVDGDALLTRGSDEIRGQNIRYDVTQRRIEAQGKEGGQVEIVIQPPPRKTPDGAPGASTPAASKQAGTP